MGAAPRIDFDIFVGLVDPFGRNGIHHPGIPVQIRFVAFGHLDRFPGFIVWRHGNLQGGVGIGLLIDEHHQGYFRNAGVQFVCKPAAVRLDGTVLPRQPGVVPVEQVGVAVVDADPGTVLERFFQVVQIVVQKHDAAGLIRAGAVRIAGKGGFHHLARGIAAWGTTAVRRGLSAALGRLPGDR